MAWCLINKPVTSLPLFYDAVGKGIVQNKMVEQLINDELEGTGRHLTEVSVCI
jgi:hypothetical protein